jgi:hypothetical protein
MAKPNVYLAPGANVESTDTFAEWINTTNSLVYDMGTVVLTSVAAAQPNTSVGGFAGGNSHLQGILSANTLVATQGLRGGTVSTISDLTISSNVIFNASNLVRIDANTNNFNVNANNTTFTGNVIISAPTKTLTINTANTLISGGTVVVNSNAVFNSDVTVTGNLTSVGAFTINAGTWNGTAIGINRGGTGQTTANAAYAALSPMTTLGDIVYRSTIAADRLPGNITTTKQYLSQTGNGSSSAAPSWSQINKSDVGLGNVENISISAYTGTANTSTVGTITTGTWSANTIAVNRGGTGQTTFANGEILIGNNGSLAKTTLTAGQNISVQNSGGSITLAASNTNITWINGNTAGPVINSSTGSGTAIPSANATNSGVITTSSQTITGIKIFNSGIVSDVTGNLNGNANTASSVPWTGVTAKPTTVAGFGITDAVTAANLSWTNGTTSGPTVNTTGGGSAIPAANSTNSGIVTTAQQFFSGEKNFNNKLTVELNTSGTVYNTGHIELRSTNLSDVSMGFHRSGGTACQLRHATDGLILSGSTQTSAANFVATGNVSAFSDIRLKTNIRTVDNALNKVMNMRGVYFDKAGVASVGVIAQEIEKILPEVVNNDYEFKSVSYGNIVGVLIEAIKELRAEVEELKNKQVYK